MPSLLPRAVEATSIIVVAVAVALPITAALHDVLPSHPPVAVSWTVVSVLLTVAAAMLAPAVTTAVRTVGHARTAAVTAGVLLGAALVASPLIALLGDDVPPVARLAWTLGEEDNAQIIGVAREVLMDGPGGDGLAAQFGTGFVVVATTLLRMAGTDDGVDPRLLAIDAFTVSTAAAIGVLALGMLLLAALGASGPGEAGPRWSGLLTAPLTVLTTGAATVAALGVAVVLPMRTGFLSFVWAFAWAALGGALLGLHRHRPTRILAVVLAAPVAASAYLLVRSWPFLLAAMLPAVALVALRVPWRRVAAGVRRRPVVAVVGVVVVGAVVVRILLSSALGEVLSYGREAFTVEASGISFDDRLVTALLVAAVLVAVAGLRGAADGPRAERAVILLGPAAGVLASWLLLRGLAEVIADGEFNYAGTKLLYAVAAVAAVTLLPVAAAVWSGGPGRALIAGGAAVAVILALLSTSATVRTVDDWDARLAASEPLNAVAMLEAIDRTTPELPVRCRPDRGTVATATSRWAAYFCVRWVEDALNVDRRSAYRDRFLTAPDGTFDDIVAEATAEGLYGFAYVMPLGPGWFGWDGRS